MAGKALCLVDGLLADGEVRLRLRQRAEKHIVIIHTHTIYALSERQIHDMLEYVRQAAIFSNDRSKIKLEPTSSIWDTPLGEVLRNTRASKSPTFWLYP